MIRVLIVGQGGPTTGGIPSFVADVLDDPWLRARVRLDFLNTTSQRRGSPGAATVGNARLALAHARQTFARARDVDVVHLNVAPAPALPLLRAIVLCAAARAAGARTILHAHSGRIDRCAQSPLYRALLRSALALTHAFVVVSSSAECAVSALGAAKVVRIPNGSIRRRSTAVRRQPTHPCSRSSGRYVNARGSWTCGTRSWPCGGSGESSRPIFA